MKNKKTQFDKIMQINRLVKLTLVRAKRLHKKEMVAEVIKTIELTNRLFSIKADIEGHKVVPYTTYGMFLEHINKITKG